MLSHCVNIGLKRILTYSELQLRNVLGTLQAVKARPPLDRQVGLHTSFHCHPYSLTRSHRILIRTHGCAGTIQYHLPNPTAILSTSSVALKTYNNDFNKKDEAKSTSDKSKTKKDSPIILIDKEDKVSVTSLSQAEKIARQRDLKVVKVEDSSLRTSDKQVYKLMTGKQYFDEEVKAKKNLKSSPVLKREKVLTISSKIAAHDLKSKQKKMKMWLDKGYQIKVTITSRGTENKDAENIFAAIEEDLNNKGRILQQQVKAGNFKFSIVPPKVDKKADEAKIQDEQNHAASGVLDNSQVVDSNQEVSSELTKS